jgi:hypothetical protein
VAANVGYCGLDKQRLPLRGDEMRACWEDGEASARSDESGIELPVIDPTPALSDGGLALWVDAER